MKLSDLRIGQLITLKSSSNFDYQTELRVEAIGFDWAVLRDERNHVWLFEASDSDLISDSEEEI